MHNTKNLGNATPNGPNGQIISLNSVSNIIANTIIGNYGSQSLLNEFRAQMKITHDLTVFRLCANSCIAPGTGNSYIFTLRKNGVHTSLVTTISGSEKSASNMVSSIDVKQGDLISVLLTYSGTPVNTCHLCSFELF